MNTQHIQNLKTMLGKAVMTEPKVIEVMSQDHYWFSPVLKPQLEHKLADVIVQPTSVDNLTKVIAYAFEHDIPLTPRGSGTGNYGQGMPMQGGIVLSTHGLKNILELKPDSVKAQAGVRLGTLEREARKIGSELRMYPSTYATATLGGFIAGGAGGVGSVTWGTLWDEGNVLAATVMTIEATPRVLSIEGHEALKSVIHSCGLTCIILDIKLALAKAERWQQYVVSFDNFFSALDFSENLAYDPQVKKRLISLHEWPIPSFFKKLREHRIIPENKSVVLLELTLNPEQLEPLVKKHHGQLQWHGPHETYSGGIVKLSDFSWNHTTLWAIKSNPRMTYLQDSYDRDKVREQLNARKKRFPELMHHIEFMRFGGPVYPQGMTLLPFTNKAHLDEIKAFSESLGIPIADAHTHKLDEDIRWNGQPILDAKKHWDPKGLLNPGHLRALERE
jgi:FAD/FMN-containing dehydrogenase